MSSEVFSESILKFELHATLFANVFHFMKLQMIVEVFLSLETLPARWTLKLFHLGFVFVMFVEVQRALARIRSPAYVTDVAGLCVVVLDMGRIIGLYFEHFSALFAIVFVILRVPSDTMDLKVGFCPRFKLAQVAGVQLGLIVMYLHMARQVGRGFERLGTYAALVGS